MQKDGRRARALAKERDAVGVARETVDIGFDPLEGELLVVETPVARGGIVFRAQKTC